MNNPVIIGAGDHVMTTGALRAALATGAGSGLDVARFLLAGARAEEMTSAGMAGGFDTARRAVQDLAAHRARTGGSAEDLIGLAADRQVGYGVQPDRPGYWREFVPPEAR
jgi:hypothetical protein